MSMICGRGFWLTVLFSAALAVPALAADVGPSPPTITAPVNVTGNTRIVGSTIISVTGTNNATNVSGGTLTLDSTAGPSPGAITIQTVNGNGLNATAGNIVDLNGGLSITTQGGHAVLANGANADITLDGASISTTGVGAGLVAIGGTIDASNVTIDNVAHASPSVSAGHGVVAESGGTITLGDGVSVTTGALNSVGLGASGAGSTVSETALVSVTMKGRTSTGLYDHDGGQVSLLPGSTISMKATGSVGATIDNTTVAAGTLDNLTIDLDGVHQNLQSSSSGFVAINNSKVTINNLTVQGADSAAGVWARPGTEVTLGGNSVIDINGAGNPVYYTLSTATLVTPSGSVGSSFSVTGGLPAGGLLSNTARIASTGTTITIASENAVGAYAGATTAGNTGRIDLADNTISVTGLNAFGLEANSGGVITADDSSITQTGRGGAALYITTYNGSGSITLTGTTVATTQDNTFGFFSENSTGNRDNTFSMTGGSLHSASVAMGVVGPADINLNNVDVSGGDLLLAAYDSEPTYQPRATFANVTVSDHSTLQGDVEVEDASRADLDISDHSHWTGASFNATNITLDPTSTWTVPASSWVSHNIGNAGTIALTHAAGGDFKTLSTGNYSGTGKIVLNTYLGDDSSPSDRLVINGGTATGSTALDIVNAGGPGALTVGNGILVVATENGGTTAADAFKLNGIVAEGPYEYLLFRGGATAVTEEDWFLRSSINCALPDAPVPPCPAPPNPKPPKPPKPPPPNPDPDPPAPPGPPGPNPPTPDPPKPPPIPPPPDPSPTPDDIPIFRPEAAVYAKVPQLAREMGMLMLGQFHIREGDQSLLGDDEDAHETWARLYVTGLNQHGGGLLSPQFDGTVTGVQGGFDLVTDKDDDGTTERFGPFAGYAHTDGDVKGFVLGQRNFGAGSAPMDQTSVGAYWTRVAPSRWYADAVGMVSWYDTSPHSNRGIGTHFDGLGVLLSLESGYPIALDDDINLEPMGQLVWQSVDFGANSDPISRMAFDTPDAWYGRLGARLEDQTAIAQTPTQLFLQGDIWKSFGGKDTTVYDNVIPLSLPFTHTDIELGAGANAQLSEDLSLYIRADYTFSIDGNQQRAIQGNMGLRYAW